MLELQLHPGNAQTTRVGLSLAFGWVQFLADKLTACHGLQKNPVQCNTVEKGVGTWPATNAAAAVLVVAAGTHTHS